MRVFNKLFPVMVLTAVSCCFLTGCTDDDWMRASKSLMSTSGELYEDINGNVDMENIRKGKFDIHMPSKNEIISAINSGLETYNGNNSVTVDSIKKEATEKAKQTGEEVLKKTAQGLKNAYEDHKSKSDSAAGGEVEDPMLSDRNKEPVSDKKSYVSSTELPDGSIMEVHYIDVGQGLSCLVKCGDHALLYDAGENDKGTLIQNYLKKQGVNKLDYFIISHNDSDHCGGADVIITKYDIGKVFMSDFNNNTATYRDVIDALSYRNYKPVLPTVGFVYPLGDATFTILSPNRTYDTTNNSSIAILLQHGEKRFLFTGDCEEQAEKDILKNGIDIHADVYQAGHHGSKTASSQEFLNEVSPKFCVISCGQNNSYWHPHASTLNKLRKMGVNVYRNDEQGSIIAESDGTSITWNCSPTESWKAGEGPQ